MKKEAERSKKDGNGHAKAHEHNAPAIVDEMLPEGSWQRVAAGVATAAGGGLLAAALVGVGPAALAGAAGYLAYRGLHAQHKDDAS